MSLLISSTLLSCDPLSPSAMHFLTSPPWARNNPDLSTGTLVFEIHLYTSIRFLFPPIPRLPIDKMFHSQWPNGCHCLGFRSLVLCSLFLREGSIHGRVCRTVVLSLCLDRPSWFLSSAHVHSFVFLSRRVYQTELLIPKQTQSTPSKRVSWTLSPLWHGPT